MGKLKLFGGLILWDILLSVVFFFALFVWGFFFGISSSLGSTATGVLIGFLMWFVVMFFGINLILEIMKKVLFWALEDDLEIIEEEVNQN